MRRLLTASAFLALTLPTATAQQPTFDPPPKVETKGKQADAAIAAALANDPDVRMAKAKIQLAEAELAKARQAVTLRVLVLKAMVERHKAEVRSAEDRVGLIAGAVEKGSLPPTQLLAERDKLEVAKAALAASEAELKLLTGGAKANDATNALDYLRAAELDLSVTFADPNDVASLLRAIEERNRNAVKGPIPARVRAALDKPVRLGAKGEKVTLAKAAEAFKKDAGLDVPVRPIPSPMPEIVSEGEELPVGAWLQLFEDTNRMRFYVREYGLLIANKQLAPPDAPTLTEFWKQTPPAKEPVPK